MSLEASRFFARARRMPSWNWSGDSPVSFVKRWRNVRYGMPRLSASAAKSTISQTCSVMYVCADWIAFDSVRDVPECPSSVSAAMSGGICAAAEYRLGFPPLRISVTVSANSRQNLCFVPSALTSPSGLNPAPLAKRVARSPPKPSQYVVHPSHCLDGSGASSLA